MLYGFSGVILQGALVTLELAISSVVLAVIIGLIGAGGKLSQNRLSGLIFEGYTTLIRGVPDLVLMLLIFYGLQIALNTVTEAMGVGQIDIDPMVAGIITLGFIYGAYFTETFRGAFMAVPKGHIEAATAFGFTRGQVFRRIMFPAIGRVSSNKYIQFPIWLFTYIFRGTPLYVQLLVFYSGMYTLEIVKGTEFLNAFFRSGLNCTVLALTLNTCAYTTEIFAGAIRSVPHGEIEAARAYGFSTFKMYRCIILPSALRIALPAYSNEVILMLHSTALAFTATVPDLLKIARDINAATYQPFTAFGIAAVLYLIISYVLISLFRRAEKRWLQHVKPSSTH
ncbi:ABC transporter permease subunit [Escherichia coli]|nr:ABC transporter permease subunit [Escherichia coli]